MKDLIEKLKDKDYVRAFGLMTPEEQECYRKVGVENCYVFFQDSGWVKVADRDDDDFIYPALTYRIKPDYKLEPEYVDLEIIPITKEWLGILKDRRIPNWPTDCPFSIKLGDIPGMTKCEGFYTDKYSNGTLVEYQRISYRIEVEKKKVYARFRTPND